MLGWFWLSREQDSLKKSEKIVYWFARKFDLNQGRFRNVRRLIRCFSWARQYKYFISVLKEYLPGAVLKFTKMIRRGPESKQTNERKREHNNTKYSIGTEHNNEYKIKGINKFKLWDQDDKPPSERLMNSRDFLVHTEGKEKTIRDL